MRTEYEYIVLGLGGIGSGAAYWLARRAGRDVLGIEQFEIGHVRGGSQDHSRIIRLSYHTPGYVQLAKEAYQAWAALETDAQERLIVQTGGLDLWPPGSVIPMADYVDSLTACDVPFEVLETAEIIHRWPQFCLPEGVQGLFQAKAGIAPAARCNAAHQRMARGYGATLLENMPITAVSPHAASIAVTAGGQTFHCQKLVIAAGAWSNNLLAPLGYKLPLTITQEQVTYYNTPHAANFMPDRFPVWIWMDEPCFYGFPVYGEPGPKAAQDVGGTETTAETRTFTPDPANQRRLDAFIQQHLPAAYGPPLLTKTCLYTMPPDRDFVIDRLPQHPNIAVAIGAGHAFKFASLIGKILSELAINGTTTSDITPFGIKRPILQEANPPKQFMM